MKMQQVCLSLCMLLSLQTIAQPCNLPFSVSVSPAPVCSNRPVTFTATNIPGATYAWAGTIPLPPVQSPVVAAMPATAFGLYTVTATIGACVYQASVNVNVNITPTPVIASHNGPVCPGQTVTLNAVAGGHAGITYEWKGPNGFTLSTPNSLVPISNMQPVNAGIYTVFALTSDGCATDPVDLKLGIFDAVKADFGFGITELCDVNDEVKFLDHSVGNKTTRWDFGDATSSTAKDPQHGYPNQPVPPNASTVYTVTLISGNGNCFDTIQKNVTIGHPIIAAFAVDDDSVCQHTAINFTNNSIVTPATAPGYVWDLQDGANTTGVDITHVFDKQGEYDVRLIVTDYLGCHDSAYHHIVVDAEGDIHFKPLENNLCAGSVIRFKGEYAPQGLRKDTWDLGDGNSLSGMRDIVHAYDKPGTYHVTYSADYRICPDVNFATDIIIKPFPVIDLGPDRTVCPNGEPVAIRDIINDGNPKAKWKWNTEVMNTASTITVYAPGTYTATVDVDGCTAADEVIVTKDCYINLPNAFTPNGDGNDDYFLPKELLSRGLSRFSMTIFNRWGGKIFETNSTTGRGWDGRFNSEGQPLGVYVYLIEAEFVNGVTEKYQGNITLLR